MSAAIWAEPETDAAHHGLGRVTVHREELAGRVPLPKARIVVWGETEAARRRAEDDARGDTALSGYRIALVEQADAPIDSLGDRTWIAFGGAVDRTWIAYQATDR